jgi:hypothetical protein
MKAAIAATMRIAITLIGQHAGEPERDLRGDRYAAGLEKAEQDERAVARVDEKVLHHCLSHGVPPRSIPARPGHELLRIL